MSMYNDILDKCLYPITILGLNPLRSSNKIRFFSMGIMLLFNLSLVSIHWYQNSHNYHLYGELWETMNFFTLTFVKFSLFIGNGSKIIKMVNRKINNLWLPKSKDELKLVKRISTFYQWSVASSAGTFILKSLVTNTNLYPLYTPEFFPVILILPTQIIFYIFSVGVLCAVDPFNFTVLKILCLQLQMINEKIRTMKFDENYRKTIKICIERYNEFFEILELYNKSNGLSIFIHIFLTEILLCAELFLNKMEFSWERFLASAGVCLNLLINFTVLYAWPATSLREHVDDIKKACFDSDWLYSEDVSFHKDLVMLMNGSRRSANVEAWKFFNISMVTTTRVFNTIVSFYGFINAVL